MKQKQISMKYYINNEKIGFFFLFIFWWTWFANCAEVRGITNRKTVLEGYENVQAALLDYTLTCYPSVEVSTTDSMIQLLSLISFLFAFNLRIIKKSVNDNSEIFVDEYLFIFTWKLSMRKKKLIQH